MRNINFGFLPIPKVTDMLLLPSFPLMAILISTLKTQDLAQQTHQCLEGKFQKWRFSFSKAQVRPK